MTQMTNSGDRHKKQPQNRGRCIFCDGASGISLTKEHIFPNWLRIIYRRSAFDLHTFGTTSWDSRVSSSWRPTTTRQRKQGHVSSRTVRVVCKICNGGWLSAMENQIKPLLAGLICGDATVLGVDAQRLLATWAAKTAMTCEFVDRTKIAISSEDRRYLMENGAVPDERWWIWIAGSQGVEWNPGLNHFSARLNGFPVDPDKVDIPNMQSTTIGLGRILLFLVSTNLPNSSFSLKYPDAAALKQIWPSPSPAIPWPPLQLLTDVDINFIARNLPRAFSVATE